MKKMNNKGFSLVELIIVIAIMAILLVVLAPQYLKYVERSRNATDLQNATQIVDAMQIYAADPEATVAPAAGSVTIGNAAQAISNTTFLGAALDDAGLLITNGASTELQTRCQSRTTWTTYTINWTITDGNLAFTYSSNSTETPDPFETRMAGGN